MQPDAGAEAEVISCADFSADKAAGYDAIAFGCPAMGSEELEYDEFQPMWDEVKDCLLYTSPSPRDPKTSRMPSSA